ncbi:MAG: flagellar motor switch protein FliM [Candidatus Wallbacteria bacterium HGW-Wallbacteria-1]|uniref:Flagellar motor switch protein FliM n=1 Tax=Candidatus Wallbacteria bacterium HGW-Wallbacteria-1 TaxID=2013854 RepID=A0A2N1PSQ8_9BACT|nr:MAG: flagellar motor switch protein FliM [Candidatus Wallbacteria bacterium HGW-Wallbacteria-1]
MVEVLSQNEIDSLLSAISAGELKAKEIKEDTKHKKIKIYDFKRPDKFSKDQIRMLNNIHETFARFANTYLTTLLRTMVNIEVVSIDEITYEEFIRSIANPTVISIFELGGLEGTAVMEINLGVVFTIIDRLFGGSGKGIEKIRPLTDIETTVMRRVILRLLSNFKEAWASVVELNPKLEFIESNPQFTQIVPPNDMVLLVTFETRIAESEGIMNICIPYIVLEPIVGKLQASFWYSTVKREISDETREAITQKVSDAYIDLVAELGHARITMSDILGLELGDVITLDQTVHDPILVKVQNQYKFFGRPGVVGKKMGVKILKTLTPEEERVL